MEEGGQSWGGGWGHEEEDRKDLEMESGSKGRTCYTSELHVHVHVHVDHMQCHILARRGCVDSLVPVGAGGPAATGLGVAVTDNLLKGVELCSG